MDGVSAENWEIIKQCLPDGWDSKAYELGALRRKRKIESADELLRLLLIHLATDKSCVRRHLRVPGRIVRYQ